MAKKVLGRGLGAFFPDMESDKKGNDSPKGMLPTDVREKVNTILNVPVQNVRPNPHQPRTDFDEFKLLELSESVKQHGLIQPITVRQISANRYELISGERRLRASKMAGLENVPAYIREVNDEQLITFAIIENIQREQLNPIETALGYQRLIEECSLTQEEVAKRVDKNRTTVTNSLRLLNLPPAIQAGLKEGRISAGHARTLIPITDPKKQEHLYHRVIEQELSVRELEDLVRNLSSKKTKAKTSKAGSEDIILREITNRLRRTLATKVNIKQKNKGGEIRIEYYTDEELERLINLFDNLNS